VYTHFTSPIRRYPDLLVHRLLRATRGGNLEAQGRLGAGLEDLGESCSRLEREAEAAERELLLWKKIAYVRAREGETFEGIVVGVARFGLFVQLVENLVEGLLHVARLGDDRFEFHEGRQELRGARSGRAYRLGDRLRVVLDRVDWILRRVDLALALGAGGAHLGERSLPPEVARRLLGPGFLLASLYLAYLLGRSFINPKLGPPVPKEERIHGMGVMVKEVLVGVVPLVGLIAAALGSILAGLATPTEAAGIGALGAAILAAAYGKLSYAGVKRAVLSTTATSSMVLLLATTSNIFGAVFARFGTANWITEMMLALPLSPVMMLIVVLLLIFLLGWPFEWPAIILVFLPIFYPVMDALKPTLSQAMGIPVDMVMVWFGALVAVTLQTAFLSPPVAMSAYYLRQVVREWSLATIYKGMLEFMILQCIAIALIVSFPAIATWFPEQLQAESRAIKTEEVDDSMNRLEEDPFKQGEKDAEEEGAGEKK